MSDAILEINDVKQAFRAGFWLKKKEVLHGISFSIPRRAVFGFLGPNGAGKTTLIQLIAGIRQPVSGSVRIAGHEAATLQARSRIGYLPERPYFHDHLTGEGLLKYFGSLSGLSSAVIKDRTTTVLSKVGMLEARRVELRKYSKGMLQRIGIAQAILHDPEFLVLDEPMSGLDPLGRKDMRELILSLAAEGRTIFFSSHVIPDVEAICDQVALIHKGDLLGCGPIGQFLSQGSIETEIAFSGIKREFVEGWSEFHHAREIPDGVRALVSSQDAVNSVIKRIFENDGRILWVTPVRPSLEDLFQERVK